MPTCKAGTVRLAGVVLDADADDLRWPQRITRNIWSGGGPYQPCCDCGVLLQTEVVARVTPLRLDEAQYNGNPPSMLDPNTVRHVPWVKQATLAGCEGSAPIFTDVGLPIPIASAHACFHLFTPQNWVMDPLQGQVFPVQEGVLWEVWIGYTIDCCKCYEHRPARLHDFARVDDLDTPIDFVAPSYPTSWQLFATAAGAYTIAILDAALNVLWTTTTTASIFGAAWPDGAQFLRVTGVAGDTFMVEWQA